MRQAAGHYSIQAAQSGRREASLERIAVVQAGGDERMDKSSSRGRIKRGSYSAQLAQLIIASTIECEKQK